MAIIKWKVYCNDENGWIYGYLEDTNPQPDYCFHNLAHIINSNRTKQVEKITEAYTDTIVYWKMYCETEQAYVYGYSDINPYPEHCFNNNSHTTSGKPIEIRRIKNNHQKIEEEYIDTGGYFQSHSYKLICPVGESVHDYTYPYPITALCVKFTTTNDHIDDQLTMEVAPNSIIGIITSNVSIGESTITISDTVIDNVSLGFYVSLFDGVNTDNVGKIVNIDKINNSITLENNAAYAFSASNPTYVRITVRVMDNYIIGYPDRYILGESKIGGSYVPTDTVVRVIYNNNGASSKNFYAILEMLY